MRSMRKTRPSSLRLESPAWWRWVRRKVGELLQGWAQQLLLACATPGCLHSSERDLQCTHPSTYVTGHRSPWGHRRPGLEPHQPVWATMHIAVWASAVQSSFHCWECWCWFWLHPHKANCLISFLNSGYLLAAKLEQKDLYQWWIGREDQWGPAESPWMPFYILLEAHVWPALLP